MRVVSPRDNLAMVVTVLYRVDDYSERHLARTSECGEARAGCSSAASVSERAENAIKPATSRD